jgi:hypothetical protein
VYKAHPGWFVLDRNVNHTSLHAPDDKEKFTACFGTGWYDYIKEILLKMAVEYGIEYYKLDFAVVISAYTRQYQVKSMNGTVITQLTGKDLEKQGFALSLEGLYSGELFEICVL